MVNVVLFKYILNRCNTGRIILFFLHRLGTNYLYDRKETYSYGCFIGKPCLFLFKRKEH